MSGRREEEVCRHEVRCPGQARAAGQQTRPGHCPPGNDAGLWLVETWAEHWPLIGQNFLIARKLQTRRRFVFLDLPTKPKISHIQLRRLMANLTQFHLDCHKLFDGVKLFPIEMDLARSAFQTSDSTTEEFHDHVSDGEEVRQIRVHVYSTQNQFSSCRSGRWRTRGWWTLTLRRARGICSGMSVLQGVGAVKTCNYFQDLDKLNKTTPTLQNC